MDKVKPKLPETHGPGKRKRCRTASSENSGIESSSITKRLENKQESVTSTDDSMLRKAKKSMGRFFYENGLDFNVVNSPSFRKMISVCSGQMNYEIPTGEELGGWILEDAMKEMKEYVYETRNSWADTGCSILLDGWTDAKGRDLVNILVDCPKGTVYLQSYDISDCIGNVDAMKLFLEKVLTEIGINNVVQIITYSASAFMKEVSQHLMEKHRSIFWTVSASSCIGLMLEKLEGMDLIKETLSKAKIITRFFHSHPNAMKHLHDQIGAHELVKPSKIRSMQPFLTLENIVEQKKILKSMFLYSDSKSSILTSNVEWKKVADLVSDDLFWNAASTVLKGAIPLVRVIELMNKGGKEQMGLIYETIDQAKETIKEGFKSKKSQYIHELWKAIDDIWNELLYSQLHSAAYFLNPRLFYSSDVFIDPEVATGLLYCIVRLVEDRHVQNQIVLQIEQYRMAKGAFDLGWPVDKRSNVSPALWWSKYGVECPELQRLAIRILSQTCDGASKFQLKRSLAETLLTKGRSQIEQKQRTDMVFLHYNMQLQNFACGKISYLTSNEVGSIDDWLVDKAQNSMPQVDNSTSMGLDGASMTHRGVIDLEGPAGFHPKVEFE